MRIINAKRRKKGFVHSNEIDPLMFKITLDTWDGNVVYVTTEVCESIWNLEDSKQLELPFEEK